MCTALGATASPVSCWELGCHWQVLFCWELVRYLCPDGTPHTLCSALLGSVSSAHILLAVTHCFCPARSCCVACVLLGAGVSLRALALRVSCWESAGPCVLLGAGACEGAQPHWELATGSWGQFITSSCGQSGLGAGPCHISPVWLGVSMSHAGPVTLSPPLSARLSHRAHSPSLASSLPAQQISCSQGEGQGHPATACSAEGHPACSRHWDVVTL